MKTRLTLLLTVGLLSISSSAILVRLCDDAPPAVIAAARVGIATLVLMPGLAIARRGRIFQIPGRLMGHILLGGALLALHFYFWMTSLRHTSVLSSVVIVTTNPIFVGLGSWLFFGERISRQLLFGIGLAAVGGAVIALRGAGDGAFVSIRGEALALLGALTASGYFLIGRRVRVEVDTFSYMVAVYGAAAALLCAIMLLEGHSFGGYRTRTYLCFAALALAPQLLGHGSLNYALKHLSATVVSVCILAEPIGASILAYFALGETADGPQMAGSALILLGIFLAARPSRPNLR